MNLETAMVRVEDRAAMVFFEVRFVGWWGGLTQ